MSIEILSDLFKQVQLRYRWAFLLIWNGLAVGGIVTGMQRNLLENQISLILFTVAGLLLMFMAIGLLFSFWFRQSVLIPDYSLDGYRLLLGCAGFAGLLIGSGAGMMLMAG